MMTRRKAFLKGKIHYDTFSALTPYGSLWSFSVKFLFLGLTLKIPLMWFLMIPRFSYLSVLCLTLWPCGSWSGHGESSLKAELHASRKSNSSVSPFTCSWWPLSSHHWNLPSHQQITVQVELFLEGPHPLILCHVPLTSQESLTVLSWSI